MLAGLRLASRWAIFVLVFGLLAATLPAEDRFADPIPKGLRIYSAGHSFHFFVQPILKNMAELADLKEHKQVGRSAIGGSRVIQHWTTQTEIAKESNEATLPVETIHVASTDRFAPSGQITVETSDGPTVITYTGIKGKTLTGCTGGKGTLMEKKKVTQEDNAIRQALKSGQVDVLTMSPIYLPDPGIENFVKLAIDNNPKIRIYVQENWLPWDHYDPKFKAPAEKVDHNAPTGESLRKLHAPYFKSLEEHVADLNKKYDTKAVHVAPVGQAVIALREKIIAGEVPALKMQDDLFTDPIGHAKPPLQALEGYCYFAAIYRKSPVGLPMPDVLKNNKDHDEKLNRLLQEIAWAAVKNHPLAGVQLSEPKP
jgi:hypothetical protein